MGFLFDTNALSELVRPLFGRLQAQLELDGTPLEDLDVQIAATAIQYGLTLVTGNLRLFERVPGLALSQVLADARFCSREPAD